MAAELGKHRWAKIYLVCFYCVLLDDLLDCSSVSAVLDELDNVLDKVLRIVLQHKPS